MAYRWITNGLGIVLVAACQLPVAIAERQQDLQKEAAGIVSEFVQTLKPQLKQALKSGGPAQAIEICSHKAPALTRQLAQKTGWSIRRVSLKPRNQLTGIPDAWEKEVLQQFDQRLAAGEIEAIMTATTILDRRFRYMQAQLVEPVCLMCHGEKVSAEVISAIQKIYPQDLAIGYSLGQVRGAFSLSRSLD